ncbi:MAG: sugar-transfer associated ATP-grasp domain-containing protein, partial [Balneolaceae bacterium]|nr:sugar-transfer associated ATP-grasp domain-containing protein [Balneolaceae bacterium]
MGYYLKQLDKSKFGLFLDFVQQKTNRSRLAILVDLLNSIFTYNISILEYFQFHFFNQTGNERASWAGTGLMYEYQLQMNPESERQILNDKRLFHKHYGEFVVHKVADIHDLKTPSISEALLSNRSGKVVFKAPDGKSGAQVEIRNASDFKSGEMAGYMKKNNYGLVEEFIQQHPEMNRLSPSGVNTVRIITQLNEAGEVDILGCRLRISVDSPVDNMAAGNLAAPIDKEAGKINGPAVYSDITKPEQETHPVTGVKIPGF